jgi:putative hydrolase of the HAD superfamily
VKAIIFDLDNCLCPASAVGPDFFEPAFNAVRAANRGVPSEVDLERAIAECWYTAFDAIALQFGFSKAMVEAGHTAFAQLEVTSSLVGYADLPIVRELPGTRYFVTSGFRKLQESRIRALGIASWFDNVFVDAIDEPEHPGKQKIFEAILAQGPWCADEVMVVGDNPRSELTAGRSLGMVTVQILRPLVSTCADVDHHVAWLEELRPLLTPARSR